MTSSALTTTGRSGTRPASDRDQVVRHLAEMLAREGWPRERLIAHQRARLRDLLAHAVGHSPYYAKALGPCAAERPLSTRWAMMCGFKVALLGSRSGRILPP